jgi:hypothetical protein
VVLVPLVPVDSGSQAIAVFFATMKHVAQIPGVLTVPICALLHTPVSFQGAGSLFRKTPKGSWIGSYWDHKGKRREHSTQTTDRQTAERILSKLIADNALRREGVIDPRDDRFASEGRKSLVDHVATYIAHCERRGLDDKHIASKARHLEQ